MGLLEFPVCGECGEYIEEEQYIQGDSSCYHIDCKYPEEPNITIGDGTDPIEKEFLEWYRLEGYDEADLHYGNMLSCWNAAFREYSPKKPECDLLTHISRLILYHPNNVNVNKEKAMEFIQELNRSLGIEPL